ncbi:MAG TPA: hypothetical protein VGD41_10680 [Pyrinomonadaceae bacterium]
MKRRISGKPDAFTLVEMFVGIGVGSTVLAIALTTSIAVQRSLNAVDNYSATHMQQIRIVDYLARDVKRGLTVTCSADKQTITIKLPKYVIEAGDADATPSNIGTPRLPTRTYVVGSGGDPTVNYYGVTSTVIYKVRGSSILREEDGKVTTIASSTDNLIPETIDIDLANTGCIITGVTFKPISVADRSGTAVYSTAYLRNRRR